MTAGDAPAVLARRLDGLYVLAVDDDADSRTVLAMLLTIHGANVTSVGSAAEAQGELALTIPMACVEARREGADEGSGRGGARESCR